MLVPAHFLRISNALMARIENASEYSRISLQHTDSEIKRNDPELVYTAKFKRQHLHIAALFVWIL